MASGTPDPAIRIAGLVQGLLDRDYQQTTTRTLQAVAGSSSCGIVAQRLRELDTEVARLNEAGERLRPDNPVLKALLSDMSDVQRRNAGRIDAAAPDVQSGAARAAGTLTRQLALPGMSNEQLRAAGIAWNVPDPEAVNALVGYVDNPAWSAWLRRYPDLIVDTVNNQAIRGLAEGWGPLRTSRAIQRVAQGLPAHQANVMMRTLQLQSYRSATAIHQQANANILVDQVRIAALDDRTCLACIAEHGTVLKVGERVIDHHAGRCTSIARVRGRERSVATGDAWFSSLPEARQREIAGAANYEAMQAGRVALRDFSTTYEDDVFGTMLREASLEGVLGAGAKEFYSRG